jgi:vacuolar-type H+-ATPase subunit D/Vma8
MTDVAFLTAQNQSLSIENSQLQGTLKNTSAQLKAYVQGMQEYLQSNVNLRALNFIHEDTIATLNQELGMFRERVQVLENEKVSLLANLEAATKPAAQEDAA